MKRKSSSRSGLVGLMGSALVGAACLLPAGKASGEHMQIYNNTPAGVENPSVEFYHYSDAQAQEGLDSLDSLYSRDSETRPIIDFYSNVDSNKLEWDVRPADSLSTANLELIARNLTESITTDLGFYIVDDTNFTGKPMYADLYDSGMNPISTNIDVRDYSTNNTTIPLEFDSDGDKYFLNMRFTEIPEPGTLSLLAMAGIGAGVGYLASRKKK